MIVVIALHALARSRSNLEIVLETAVFGDGIEIAAAFAEPGGISGKAQAVSGTVARCVAVVRVARKPVDRAAQKEGAAFDGRRTVKANLIAFALSAEVARAGVRSELASAQSDPKAVQRSAFGARL